MENRTIRTTCSYCSVGCNLDVTVGPTGETMIRPSPDYPVNRGSCCPKGQHLVAPFQSPDRATHPLLRNQDGELREVSWEQAIDMFVTRFRRLMETYGPEAVAFLSTGQMPTEEMAFLGALTKFGMGMVHGDGNTRQCMTTTAVAYREAFGFDAPPFTYGDVHESDLLIFVGANPAISHPVFWHRVQRRKRTATTVAIDPRRTKTTAAADVHISPNPKSDLTLLYGIARDLIQSDRIDRGFVDAHTEGFPEFAEFVEQFTLDRTSRETGLSRQTIRQLADVVARSDAMSIWWTMGVNQGHQGVRTAQAIINLCLITGNIGRPGTGPNSISGQTNAMGARLFSNTVNALAGYSFTDASDRRELARRVGVPESVIPRSKSLPYHQILDRAARGEIKALWVIATNPAHSWIDRAGFAQVMGNLDFLVVQDLYADTATARHADLFLPAAGSVEKDGTVINSERRIGLVQKVLDPPGDARSDFQIFRMIADRWGCGDLLQEWSSPEAVFRILQRTTKGRPCDITGINGYRHILEKGGIQWPYPGDGRTGSRQSFTAPLNSPAPEESQAAASATPPVNSPAPEENQAAAGATPTPPVDSPAPEESQGAARVSPTPPVDSPAPEADQAAAGATPPPPADVERRLFSDGRFFTASGRARIVFDQPQAIPEQPTREFPFVLITGRGSIGQFHTETRTGRAPQLNGLHSPGPYVVVHPDDAGLIGIEQGQAVEVTGRAGRVVVTARIDDSVRHGHLFMPLHYPETNQLTQPTFDPVSGVPAYKSGVVRIAPADSINKAVETPGAANP